MKHYRLLAYAKTLKQARTWLSKQKLCGKILRELVNS